MKQSLEAEVTLYLSKRSEIATALTLRLSWKATPKTGTVARPARRAEKVWKTREALGAKGKAER